MRSRRKRMGFSMKRVKRDVEKVCPHDHKPCNGGVCEDNGYVCKRRK